MWWLIAAQAFGLAAFPLAYHLLPKLRDRGYSVSKPLGILLVSYTVWILSSLHLVPYTRLALFALLLILAGVSLTYAWRHRIEIRAFVLRERYVLLATEGIFLLFYIGWLIYRAYDPSIAGTEKPMDFAFLNASLQARFSPPEDPWLIGNPISYYYFGYWMMASVTKLTAIPSNIAYNLALALIPAMAASAIFGLIYNMVRSIGVSLKSALVTSLLGPVFLIVISNLEGVLEFLRANGLGSYSFWNWIAVKGLGGPAASQGWYPQDFWWWWRASRVIDTLDGTQSLDYTIQEFPFFSFLLGDLHPHMMAIPFILLFMAFCFNVLSSDGRLGLGWLFRNPLSVLVLGVSLGSLGFINVWDMPTFAALFAGAVLLNAYGRSRGDMGSLITKEALHIMAVIVVVIAFAFILYLPFYVTLSSQASGILPVEGPTTRYIHFFLVWGFFLLIVIPFLLALLKNTRASPGWAWRALIALDVGLLPYLAWVILLLVLGGEAEVARFFYTLPLALLVSLATYGALSPYRASERTGLVFGLLIVALGLMLLLGPELLYLVDFFGTRMNTVFKLYYQAWILLAVAGPFAIYYLWRVGSSGSALTRWALYGWSAVILVALAASLYYPFAAAYSKSVGFRGEATLDGLAYVARQSEAEYEAIKKLRREARAGDGLLEAVGADYTDFGRISASTGLPTVLGWPGHELQWRGSSRPFTGREDDVALIYQTEDPAAARELLDKYGIKYVYVGLRERRKYGEDGLAKFATFMEEFFVMDNVIIYRLGE